MAHDVWDNAQQAIIDRARGESRYQRLAQFVRESVAGGRLPPGARLPTVRDLAAQLGVSVTTVVNAYALLREDGTVSGQVGRGTFVRGGERVRPATPTLGAAESGANLAWRRRALSINEQRLMATHPGAVDLMRGSCDPAFLPVAALRRAWTSVAGELTADDVQYPISMDPDPELVAQVLPRLEADGVPAAADHLIVGNSTIQFLALVVESMRRDRPADWPITAAVEEPGYQAAMDVLERFGCTLAGMASDQFGVLPQQLRAAVDGGAKLVILTPRAANPTGATWSPERMRALADVLAEHPGVVVVEDDYFADGSRSRPGSLLDDRRVAPRVVHVRSFAKAIAPDMRIAAAVARPDLRDALVLVKSLTDGWTSRAAQRAMARVLADDETASMLSRARSAYADRRAAAAAALAKRLRDVGGSVQHAPDGLYTWITLPPGYDAGIVAEYTAQQGHLVAPGEPFFLRLGMGRFLRLNAGSATLDQVTAVSEAIVKAATSAEARTGSRHTP